MELVIATYLKQLYFKNGLNYARTYYKSFFISSNVYANYKHGVDIYLRKWGLGGIIYE